MLGGSTYLGARGLGVYDVALTWQRSRVRFSPSPPLMIAQLPRGYLFVEILFD